MSKKVATKKKVNKSAEVRVMLAKHPKASVKQLVAFLIAKGVQVKANDVYAQRRKIHGKRHTTNGVVLTNGHVPVSVVSEVVVMSKKLGSISKLKELVDALAN